jgi:hypothetical protein
VRSLLLSLHPEQSGDEKSQNCDENRQTEKTEVKKDCFKGEGDVEALGRA